MDNCSEQDCPYPVRTRGLCARHYRRQLHSERSECSVEGCTTRWHAGGLCVKHYTRMRAWGTTEDREPPPLRDPCSVTDCPGPVKARGLCGMHLQREYRSGTTELDWRAKERTCHLCKRRLSGNRFPLARASACIDCLLEYRAQLAAKRLKRTPAIRRQEEKLKELQGSCCAICGIPEEKAPKGRLHLDHCHSTKVIRGLLCARCNTGLGQFQDDPALLAAAITYLAASASAQPSGL